MRHYKENLAISLHRRRLYMQTILPYKTPTFVCKLFFVIPGGYPSGVMGEKIEIESPKIVPTLGPLSLVWALILGDACGVGHCIMALPTTSCLLMDLSNS
jgi:hypothetical protein